MSLSICSRLSQVVSYICSLEPDPPMIMRLFYIAYYGDRKVPLSLVTSTTKP